MASIRDLWVTGAIMMKPQCFQVPEATQTALKRESSWYVAEIPLWHGHIRVAKIPNAWLLIMNFVVAATTVLVAVATKFAPKFTPSPAAYLGAGLITGVTETATGIGGPPLALVYQHHPAPTLRATIALCFLLGEVFSLTVLAMKGRLGLAECSTALALMVPLVLGLAGSALVHRWLRAERLRNALLVFAVVSGVVLIIQSSPVQSTTDRDQRGQLRPSAATVAGRFSQ